MERCSEDNLSCMMTKFACVNYVIHTLPITTPPNT